MTILQYIYLYGVAVTTFLAMDMVWLGLIAKDFYRTHLGPFMGDVQWLPAIIFYLLYTAGILLFAVLPGLQAQSLLRALMLGAVFGFLAYATYDLTNLATLRDWPLVVTLVDLAWGAVLTGSVATVTYYLASRFIL
jgi:uncharacterized membrane protein